MNRAKIPVTIPHSELFATKRSTSSAAVEIAGRGNENELETWSQLQLEHNEQYKRIPIRRRDVNVLEIEIVEVSNFQGRAGRYSQVEVECDDAIGQKVYKTTKKCPVDSVIQWGETVRFVLDEHVTAGAIKVSILTQGWRGSFGSLGSSMCGYTEDPEERQILVKSNKVLLKLSRNKDIQLRLCHGLCDQETQFRLKRIPKVMEAMREILDDKNAPKSLFETPVVSIMGSGGGLRAACAMIGFMEALDEIGVSDCSTYTLGTSGSSWYLSGAYARRACKRGKDRDEYHSWMRNSFKSSAYWELFNIKNYRNTYNAYKAKKEDDVPFTLVDFYGFAVSERLFGAEIGEGRLSGLRSYVETTEVPYPLLNCTQVDDFHDVRKYRADVNFTPHECEIPQYGVNVDSEYLNSRFYSGVLQQRLQEPNLCFITGTTGSVFGLRMNRILGLDAYEDEKYFSETQENASAPETPLKPRSSGMMKWISSLPQLMGRNTLVERTGQILNFAYGLPNMQRFPIDPLAKITRKPGAVDGFKEEDHIMSLVDGGILCNVAVDAALRPQRTNDILIIGDFTDYEKDVNFETLESAIRLANVGKCKFPPVNMEEIKTPPTKELYIFEDPDDEDCPIVFWFLLSTEKFKQNTDFIPKNRDVLKLLARGEKFTDFEVFGSEIYDTFNTAYSNLDFDRLTELVAYNVRINEKVIKEKIAAKVSSKRAEKKNIFKAHAHHSTMRDFTITT